LVSLTEIFNMQPSDCLGLSHGIYPVQLRSARVQVGKLVKYEAHFCKGTSSNLVNLPNVTLAWAYLFHNNNLL